MMTFWYFISMFATVALAFFTAEVIFIFIKCCVYLIRDWLRERKANKIKPQVLKNVYNHRPNPHALGFWKCEKCTHDFLYMNQTEMEALIDHHVCREAKKNA